MFPDTEAPSKKTALALEGATKAAAEENSFIIEVFDVLHNSSAKLDAPWRQNVPVKVKLCNSITSFESRQRSAAQQQQQPRPFCCGGGSL